MSNPARCLPDSHQDPVSETGWRFECDWCGAGLVIEAIALADAIEVVRLHGWEHKACGIDWCGCNKRSAK